MNMALAMVAGGFCSVLAMPFFTIKTQMQVQSSVADLQTGHQHKHKGFLDAFGNVWREEGVGGFYKGFTVFTGRIVMLVVAQMTTYDAAKDYLVTSNTLSSGPLCHTISSAVAAGAGAIAMQPFDLVVSRMMNQPVVDGKPTLYATPIECVTKTVRNEGVLALYKGLAANYTRMAPQYILTFVFYEKFMGLWKQYREKDEGKAAK
eukprot:FR744323.1.p1 GENE.FR744323.1~~FR744323.1.p1  ORF type:complete len:205 (+),score=29.11 FR744323.1:2-616(+)